MDEMFFRRMFDESGMLNSLILIPVLIISGFVIVISLIVVIFYLLSLYKNLNAISVKNRKMEPGLVWLNLIPCFSLGWMIYTVLKIKESNELEFKEKNISYSGDYGYGVGLAYTILNIVSTIPYLGILTGIAALVCWIIYWINISNLSKLLKERNINSSEANNVNSNL